MQIGWTFLLTALVAGPVYAACSGGDGGGLDATGNQCSTPDYVAQSDKMSGAHVSTPATVPLIRSLKMSVLLPTAKIVAAPVSRIVQAAVLATPPVKTAKVENWAEAACSGGAGGGMDVNGNQCDPAPVVVAAK